MNWHNEQSIQLCKMSFWKSKKPEGPTGHCTSHANVSFLGSARRLLPETFWFWGRSWVLPFSPWLLGQAHPLDQVRNPMKGLTESQGNISVATANGLPTMGSKWLLSLIPSVSVCPVTQQVRPKWGETALWNYFASQFNETRELVILPSSWVRYLVKLSEAEWHLAGYVTIDSLFQSALTEDTSPKEKKGRREGRTPKALSLLREDGEDRTLKQWKPHVDISLPDARDS